MRWSIGLVSLVSLVACHASAEVKTGGGVSADVNANESKSEQTSTFTATAPTPPPEKAQPAPPPPSAPPPSACPLSCYVASGGDRIPVTDQELANIRSGLEPVMGRMRQCVDAESWRRRGSPTVLLRVAADGSAAETDIDPDHPYDAEARCLDGTAKGATVAVSLPGRAVVRCIERCTPERATKKKPKR